VPDFAARNDPEEPGKIGFVRIYSRALRALPFPVAAMAKVEVVLSMYRGGVAGDGSRRFTIAF
jgi:hypothetical protein